MATPVKKLKAEISALAALFPRDHSRVRIMSSGCDEVVIHFLDGRKKFVIVCSGLENYLEGKPVWYSESEDSSIVSALEQVESSELKTVSGMMNVLLAAVCERRRLPSLPELSRLDEISSACCRDSSSAAAATTEPGAQATLSSPSVSNHSYPSLGDDDEDMDIDDMDEDDDEADDFGMDVAAPDSDAATGVDSGCDMDAGDRAVLERVKKTAMSEYATGKPLAASSVRSTDRLMKELKDLFKSESVRSGVFSVSLVAECLYDWKVLLQKFDPDSKLHRDLVKYGKHRSDNFIELNIMFSAQFPVTPPFVRVVRPMIEGGFVMSGGAICMELLTTSGWSVAYTLENVILQIMATMVKGKARISQDKLAAGNYSLSRAQSSFKMLTETHAKKGWYTPPKKDG